MRRSHFAGRTTEGLPLEFAVDYEDGTTKRIFGTFFAGDDRDDCGHLKPSHFDVERVEDLPWVVSEGDWWRVK